MQRRELGRRRFDQLRRRQRAPAPAARRAASQLASQRRRQRSARPAGCAVPLRHLQPRCCRSTAPASPTYAWGQAGVYLPHQSRAQYASIPHVDKGSAQPGDLLFYYSPISHVGVYLGGGQLVHAPNTGSVVKIASVNWGKVSGVGRPG